MDSNEFMVQSPSPEDMFRHNTSRPQPQQFHDNYAQIVIDGRIYDVRESRNQLTTSHSSASSPLSSPPKEVHRQQPQQVVCNQRTPPLGPPIHTVVKRNSSGSGSKPMHTCSVCGDRAFYVFYGALACDSCR